MGLLINGEWHDQWYDTKSNAGEFKREASQLRSWITADGRAGSSGDAGFKAESGRYHLYVSYACPWAHRTLIFRQLKTLREHIGVSVVSPLMLENGWSFNQDEGSTGDALAQRQFLHQLYTDDNANYSGHVTVPVLWDNQTQCIVNNESADIIRMLNSAFNGLTGNDDDYYPAELQTDIDAINQHVYDNINNGVYRCGFATEQQAYEKAYKRLFDALDDVEKILSRQRFLVGERITEADWRLFTTLIRFDAVYHGHFKCNRQRLNDFTHLADYLRELYQRPGIADTVHFDHFKRHYYISHTNINPTQIVPAGPNLDLNRSHNRNKF